MSTYFSSEEARERAWEIANTMAGGRCVTARRLLLGSEEWSLSSLKGKARSFGGSYARSRDGFLRQLKDAGLQPVTIYLRREHNRRVVII